MRLREMWPYLFIRTDTGRGETSKAVKTKPQRKFVARYSSYMPTCFGCLKKFLALTPP